MNRANWDRSGGYQDYAAMAGAGQYGQDVGGGGYEWDYPVPNASMRRGEVYNDDPYSRQFSGQMFDGGRPSYAGQYEGDSQYDRGMYSAANLQATVMQMVSNMQQAANSGPRGRGAGLIPDPQVRSLRKY